MLQATCWHSFHAWSPGCASARLTAGDCCSLLSPLLLLPTLLLLLLRGL